MEKNPIHIAAENGHIGIFNLLLMSFNDKPELLTKLLLSKIIMERILFIFLLKTDIL